MSSDTAPAETLLPSAKPADIPLPKSPPEIPLPLSPPSKSPASHGPEGAKALHRNPADPVLETCLLAAAQVFIWEAPRTAKLATDSEKQLANEKTYIRAKYAFLNAKLSNLPPDPINRNSDGYWNLWVQFAMPIPASDINFNKEITFGQSLTSIIVTAYLILLMSANITWVNFLLATALVIGTDFVLWLFGLADPVGDYSRIHVFMVVCAGFVAVVPYFVSYGVLVFGVGLLRAWTGHEMVEASLWARWRADRAELGRLVAVAEA